MGEQNREERNQKRLETLEYTQANFHKIRNKSRSLLNDLEVQMQVIREHGENPIKMATAQAKIKNTLKLLAEKLFLLKFGLRLRDEDMGPADEPPDLWNKEDKPA